MHAEHVKRSLAPGDQAAQGGFQGFAGGVVTAAVEAECVQQVDLLGLERRQRLDGGVPARQVAVADGQLGVDLRRQVGAPVLQRTAGQPGLQRIEIETTDHGRAISEAKLRHWNHGTTLLKPAASRRSRCCSRLSGFITFSMALRFCAISSSL